MKKEAMEKLLNKWKKIAGDFEKAKNDKKNYMAFFRAACQIQKDVYEECISDLERALAEQSESKGRCFSLTNEQNETLKKWMKSLPEKQFGAIDFGYTYCFTPNSLGETIIVKRADGFEIDLTDYDSF